MMDKMGLWEDAYVIITADHGEALCEHGLWDHGYSVYHTDLHVPLILRWPSHLPAGRTIAGPVRQIDLMPTILSQLNLPIPQPIQGRSMLPVSGGDLRPLDEYAFAEGVKHGHERKAIYSDGWKLIYSTQFKTYKLFNIADDHLEQRNMATTHPRPPQFVELRDALEEQIEQNLRHEAGVEDKHVPVDPKQIQRLKSLGYVGG